MFFIFGISSKEKELDFSQTMICSTCGAYGRYEAFMTYSYFSLFFIPLIKWNKKYYIRSSCCSSLYSINKDIGSEVEKGENINIRESDLHPLNINKDKSCANCGYPMEKDFQYCPKCGVKLD